MLDEQERCVSERLSHTSSNLRREAKTFRMEIDDQSRQVQKQPDAGLKIPQMLSAAQISSLTLLPMLLLMVTRWRYHPPGAF